MKASYWNPTKIKMGRGSLKSLPEMLSGRKAVLVVSPGSVERGVVGRIQALCGDSMIGVTTGVISNPTLDSITGCYSELPDREFQVIIALGGGSALDTAKAVAFMSGASLNAEWLAGYFRDGEEKPAGVAAKEIIAIPTTSGTGSEVTSWGTIWDGENGKKYSLADDLLYPEWALLDADLTDSLPYSVTLFGALDAISHSMEAIWNRNANSVSDALASESIAISIAVLADNFKDRYSDRQVRDKLQLSSLLAGLAFSNTKTALAHSMSYPLTALLEIPHGLACGFTLPEILAYNGESAREIMAPILQAMGGVSLNTAKEYLYGLFCDIGVSDYVKQFIPHPIDLNISNAQFITPGRADNNIAPVNQAKAKEILMSAVARLIGE
jgi:phosphonate metabolism-associated iron-containing alcohol dehydrogenase